MRKNSILEVLTVIVIILISLILICATMIKFVFKDVYTTKDKGTLDLRYIVDKFNASSTAKSFEDAGSPVLAKASGNEITIISESSNDKYVYRLEGKILSAIAKSDDLMTAILFSAIVDSAEQFYGVSKDEAYPTLNSDQIINFTLDKDGIEIKQLDDQVSMKLDISRKITLADVSKEYVKLSDLEDSKFIKGSGSVNINRGNIIFNKSGSDNEIVISIYEKGVLTENTYKSILSAITVIVSEAAAAEFQNKYSSLTSGDKVFDNYTIEINRELSGFEKGLIDVEKYKWVHLTIDVSNL